MLDGISAVRDTSFFIHHSWTVPDGSAHNQPLARRIRRSRHRNSVAEERAKALSGTRGYSNHSSDQPQQLAHEPKLKTSPCRFPPIITKRPLFYPGLLHGLLDHLAVPLGSTFCKRRRDTSPGAVGSLVLHPCLSHLTVTILCMLVYTKSGDLWNQGSTVLKWGFGGCHFSPSLARLKSIANGKTTASQ